MTVPDDEAERFLGKGWKKAEEQERDKPVEQGKRRSKNAENPKE